MDVVQELNQPREEMVRIIILAQVTAIRAMPVAAAVEELGARFGRFGINGELSRDGLRMLLRQAEVGADAATERDRLEAFLIDALSS